MIMGDTDHIIIDQDGIMQASGCTSDNERVEDEMFKKMVAVLSVQVRICGWNGTFNPWK